ncbi:MAG: hypothetical protein HY216_06330 [Candidatus Rokubacteria bacterium]|nr:hypothetical protein [Candidatus Rokubacteria bacterium]
MPPAPCWRSCASSSTWCGFSQAPAWSAWSCFSQIRADVRAELSDVVVGRHRGRATQEEIVIFDSTGTARQDVAAAAAAVYERACATGHGLTVALGA